MQANIAGGEGFDWFYASAADRSAQIRTAITDGVVGKPWVFHPKDIRAWWQSQHFNRPGRVESGLATAWVPQSKPIRFTEPGCPAIDRGTNQPNVFFDPKSSESFTPHFSRGWRDDAIQRAYLEASYLHWGDPANNPISSVYGGRMVHLPECAAWTWDARPYPFFPELTDVWTDGPNWRLGHWLTGRLGAVSLAALVRHLCLRAGMPEALIDVSGLWGAVEGYAITALEAPRSSISTLARHFGFDAIETEGMIRFVMRGRASVVTLAHDDLVASREGEALELVRAQETELPQALKWQVARADEDYDAALVDARRITVDTTRIASESFPMAIPPEKAERRCRRALMEAWIGRESATFRLPPSRLALDPADVIRLVHDSRDIELRLVSIADSDGRGIEAVRQDRAAYDLPPGDPRPASLTRSVVFGAPNVQTHPRKRLADQRHAGCRVDRVGVEADPDDLGRCEGKVQRAVLGQDRALPGQDLRRLARDVGAVHGDMAARGRDLGGQGPHQRGLARSVGADDRRQLPGAGGHFDAMQHLAPGQGDMQIVGDQAHPSSIRRLDSSTHMKNGPPIMAVMMPMGSSAGAMMLRLTMSATISALAPSMPALTSSQR